MTGSGSEEFKLDGALGELAEGGAALGEVVGRARRLKSELDVRLASIVERAMTRELAASRQDSYEDKRMVAAMINGVLDELSLSLVEPLSGQPASLSALYSHNPSRDRGSFRLVPRVSASEPFKPVYYETLRAVTLMPAPSRKHPWIHRSIRKSR